MNDCGFMAYLDITNADELHPLFCFCVEGAAAGNRYACVRVSDEHSAHVRMAPLFPGCTLTPVDPSRVHGPLW